jgi:subtilisin family serine protease
MASIMVGAKGILGITGTAPDARVMPVAVPLNGTTGAGSDDHLSSAIRWSADHGGKIISMSLGGTRNPSTDKVPCPVAEQEAVYYALSKGSIVLAAVGNNGQTTNAVEEPGVCLGVVSVGAVDQNGVVAPFSSRHPYLTMTAPGVAIASLSRVPGAAYSGDGTSQATALASAAMALVWSKYPTLTGRQVLTRVLATLDRRRAKADPAYGYGMINPFRAVYNNVPAGTVNPVFASVDPFLTRFTAFQDAAQAPRPNPAPARSKSVGSYRVGKAPRLFAPRVLQGLTIAGIGLLAILALTLLAWVSRRRPVGVPRESRAAPAVEPETPDATGLVWHNIIDAEEPAARQRDG